MDKEKNTPYSYMEQITMDNTDIDYWNIILF